MGDKLDKMKKAAGKATPPPAAVPPPATPPPGKAKKNKQQPPVTSGKIRFRCGHTTTHADLTNRLCHKCKLSEKLKARKRKRCNKRERTNPDTKRRLPGGSEVHAVYDAETQTWTGRFVIPGHGEFPGTHSGLFRLCSKLDADYRTAAGLIPPPAPAEGTPCPPATS